MKIRQTGRFLAAHVPAPKASCTQLPRQQVKTSKSQVQPQVLHTDARRCHSDCHTSVLPVYQDLLQHDYTRKKKRSYRGPISPNYTCSSKSSSLSLKHQEIRYPETHHLSKKAAATQHYTEILWKEKKKEKKKVLLSVGFTFFFKKKKNKHKTTSVFPHWETTSCLILALSHKILNEEICLKYFDFIEIKYLIWPKTLFQIFFFLSLRRVSFEKSRIADFSMQTGDQIFA